MRFKVFKCFYSSCLIMNALSAVIFVTDFLHPFRWIIDVSFPSLGVQHAPIQSGCISQKRESVCVSIFFKCRAGVSGRLGFLTCAPPSPPAKWCISILHGFYLLSRRLKSLTPIYKILRHIVFQFWVATWHKRGFSADKWQWHAGHLECVGDEGSPR